jgi:hypothetical protein
MKQWTNANEAFSRQLPAWAVSKMLAKGEGRLLIAES